MNHPDPAAGTGFEVARKVLVTIADLMIPDPIADAEKKSSDWFERCPR